MNLLNLFAIGRERQPDKTAIEFMDSRGTLAPQRLSFAELQRQAQEWAAAFVRMGVRKGDRVRALFVQPTGVCHRLPGDAGRRAR